MNENEYSMVSSDAVQLFIQPDPIWFCAKNLRYVTGIRTQVRTRDCNPNDFTTELSCQLM